jgi:ACR3 family arsenite transporter
VRVSLLTVLAMAARHGRMILVAGLVAGIALPDLALAMRPWLQEMVAGLLFFAALRIGPRQAFGTLGAFPRTLALALAYQLALPLAAFALFAALGLQASALAMSLLLMLSASSISGSPNLAVLTGHDPAPALRLLVLGTAILPLTAIPVFALLPELGGAAEVSAASARLLAVIAIASAIAFAIRAWIIRNPAPGTIAAIDGLSAIAMAVVVVGLMSAVGPALRTDPGGFALWLMVACAANLGSQVAAHVVLGRTALAPERVPLAIIAGNRNIALFLVALPAAVTDPLLLFIGCYQIPMYLTPLLLGRFYARSVTRK